MPGGVVFEEEQSFEPMPLPRQQVPTMGSALLNARIVGFPGDAGVLLAILALALIGVSFYLLTSSIQPPPTLGPDILRAGETPVLPR
jgi:hypothetical protein